MHPSKEEKASVSEEGKRGDAIAWLVAQNPIYLISHDKQGLGSSLYCIKFSPLPESRPQWCLRVRGADARFKLDPQNHIDKMALDSLRHEQLLRKSQQFQKGKVDNEINKLAGKKIHLPVITFSVYNRLGIALQASESGELSVVTSQQDLKTQISGEACGYEIREGFEEDSGRIHTGGKIFWAEDSIDITSIEPPPAWIQDGGISWQMAVNALVHTGVQFAQQGTQHCTMLLYDAIKTNESQIAYYSQIPLAAPLVSPPPLPPSSTKPKEAGLKEPLKEKKKEEMGKDGKKKQQQQTSLATTPSVPSSSSSSSAAIPPPLPSSIAVPSKTNSSNNSTTTITTFANYAAV